MHEDVHDVIQIGYGPVSEALALMLGQQGRKVAVVERWSERYPLPRAVCVDHELYRVLSALGMSEALPSVTQPGPLYQWFNADWKELLVIDWSAPSISGGPEVNFVHQPTLEEALHEAVARERSVDLRLGWEFVDATQDDDLVRVELRNVESGEKTILFTRFLVGCDGANSLVRAAIGGEHEDRGFEADWLVVDVLLKDGVTIEQLGIPAAGQYCNPERPTTIVPAGVREGRTFRRWEFMRLPGESIAELEREEAVWKLLHRWAGPDDIELVRHKVYNFRSLMASRWRDRRILIAGDAAHVMPPFMGQGMCAGMRDAWNLQWKIGLILDGKADQRLLDTYQAERQPHVAQITDISIYLGKIICIPDPADAARRDAAFLAGTADPPPPFPSLSDGLIRKTANGDLARTAGLLTPHVTVERSGKSMRLDDVVQGRFALHCRGFDFEKTVRPDIQRKLDALNVCVVHYAKGSAGAVRDLDGAMDDFFESQGCAAFLSRPDFYAYGAADSAAAVEELLTQFLADAAAAGIIVPTAASPRLSAADLTQQSI